MLSILTMAIIAARTSGTKVAAPRTAPNRDGVHDTLSCPLEVAPVAIKTKNNHNVEDDLAFHFWRRVVRRWRTEDKYCGMKHGTECK